MAMYQKNKVNKVFVRLSDEQTNFLDRMAEAWGRSRSDVLRSIIDSYRMGADSHADKQTDCNH